MLANMSHRAQSREECCVEFSAFSFGEQLPDYPGWKLSVIEQMRFTVKRIFLEELCFTVIFRYVNKFKWLDQVQSSQ